MADETRDPRITPLPGDIVRSRYESIGERHVVHVSDCGVTYRRVKPNGKRGDGYCLRSIWTKWCRSHRVTVVQAVDS